MMQHARKKNYKPNQTTQDKKKMMNMDEVVCFVCDENGHFTKKCNNCKGKKNQPGQKSANVNIGDPSGSSTIIYRIYFMYVNLMIGG
jgi:DnaJ-class molecular chaperone